MVMNQLIRRVRRTRPVKRLRYPHKRSAVHYLLDDPRLVFGIPRTPTKLHAASFVERALGDNIIGALHAFLPQDFQDHLARVGGVDRQGDRLMLYMLVRRFRPQIVVETGVARGTSSSYILCAMKQNGVGHLYSIDLAPRTAAVDDDETRRNRYKLPDGQVHGEHEIGDLIPENLRDRWTLIVGDAREELPILMASLSGGIDVFYHDSLHSYDHMMFEYETAWPHIHDGGLLLSDDVLWNRAFHNFCRDQERKPIIYRSFGMIRK
jgi:predicted O-methyltransferase YrrM